MTVLQQVDKRHSHKTLQIRKRCALFERAEKENLLGKLVGKEGLRGVKSWLSEELLSPSDSHSEEAGEEREDGGEEEEVHGSSSTSANFLLRMTLIVQPWWLIHILHAHKEKQWVKYLSYRGNKCTDQYCKRQTTSDAFCGFQHSLLWHIKKTLCYSINL